MIVIAAYTGIVFWLGARAGKLAESRRRSGISPEWAGKVRVYLARILEQPADDADLDDMVVLPRHLKDTGRELLYAAPGEAEAREKLRRQYG